MNRMTQHATFRISPAEAIIAVLALIFAIHNLSHALGSGGDAQPGSSAARSESVVHFR